MSIDGILFDALGQIHAERRKEALYRLAVIGFDAYVGRTGQKTIDFKELILFHGKVIV